MSHFNLLLQIASAGVSPPGRVNVRRSLLLTNGVISSDEDEDDVNDVNNGSVDGEAVSGMEWSSEEEGQEEGGDNDESNNDDIDDDDDNEHNNDDDDEEEGVQEDDEWVARIYDQQQQGEETS